VVRTGSNFNNIFIAQSIHRGQNAAAFGVTKSQLATLVSPRCANLGFESRTKLCGCHHDVTTTDRDPSDLALHVGGVFKNSSLGSGHFPDMFVNEPQVSCESGQLTCKAAAQRENAGKSGFEMGETYIACNNHSPHACTNPFSGVAALETPPAEMLVHF